MDEKAQVTNEAKTTAKATVRIPEASDDRPASPMAWSFLFEIVHHRGQISTYLRPMAATVPQISGLGGDQP